MLHEFTPPLWADLLAVAIGSMQGAMFAARFHDHDRSMDWLGIAIVGVACGLGGGLLRDLILNTTPAALRISWYLMVAVLAALTGMLLEHVFAKINPAILLLDAAALGLFAVIGTTRALNHGLPGIPSLFVGMIAGVGGSILRDLLLNVPVALMHVGSLHAISAGSGALALIGLVNLNVPIRVAGVAGIGVTATVRLLSVRFGWRLPRRPLRPASRKTPPLPDL